MTLQRPAFALLATLSATLVPAEEAAVTRDTYDAFMAAFTMEQGSQLRVGADRDG
jgi:hypothetical protein